MNTFQYADCRDDCVDWYNNEHAPARITLPAYLNGSRYKAVDGKAPSWLTLYDVTEPAAGAVTAPDYEVLVQNRSSREKDILQKIQSLSRRVYASLYNTVLPEGKSAVQLPETYHVLYVAMQVREGAEFEDEFNRWYTEEHLGLLSKIPGYIRGRRFKLSSSAARGEAENDVVGQYLAIYEFAEGGYLGTEEGKKARSTPWREATLKKSVTFSDVRMFELDKTFSK